MPLGFFGALLDALGSGGWGPIVATLSLGLSHWSMILGLGLGGVIAAPLGAWACKRVPVKPFMQPRDRYGHIHLVWGELGARGKIREGSLAKTQDVVVVASKAK